MKKKFLMKTMILMMFTIQCFGESSNNSKNFKEDCYIPKGELTCVTNLNTSEGQQKLKEVMSDKDKYQYASEKYLEKGRFGNEFVGFIGVPNWEKLMWFTDPDSSFYTLQITKNGIDIFTLDVLTFQRKSEISDLEVAREVIKSTYNGYLNAGHNKNNLVVKEVNSNGYKGMQLRVKNISGKALIQNVFVVGNKIHFAISEGEPKNIDEMDKLILDSWDPYE